MVDNQFREFRFFMPSFSDIENLRIQAYSMLALADKLELEAKEIRKPVNNNEFNLMETYSKRELGELLNVDISNFSKTLYPKGLKFTKKGKRIKFLKNDILDFLNENPEYRRRIKRS